MTPHTASIVVRSYAVAAIITTMIVLIFCRPTVSLPAPPLVLDRPTGNCLTLHDLLKNRPYPPKHGVHSYANEVPICKERL